MKKMLFLIPMLIIVAFSGVTFATTYGDYADASGYINTNVYSQNATWNRLGLSWSGEWNSAAVANNTDMDDGVSWSINGGAYGSAVMTVGDSVTFQFTLSKVEWGQHNADYMVAWIDWDSDLSFELSEKILAKSYGFSPVSDYSPNRWLDGGNAVTVATYTYTTTVTESGDYWLRARVVCNADAYNSIDNVTPTAHYFQGEIEDWKFTVNERVPEPGAILLLGLSLLGFFWARKLVRD